MTAQPIAPVFTKYGQIACGICKLEPPLGMSGVCYTCGQGETPTKYVEPDEDETTESAKPVEPVSQTDIAEQRGLRAAAEKRTTRRTEDERQTSQAVERTAPTRPTTSAKTSDKQDADLKQMSRGELEAIVGAAATTEDEVRRKGRARSRLWHLKNKGQ